MEGRGRGRGRANSWGRGRGRRGGWVQGRGRGPRPVTESQLGEKQPPKFVKIQDIRPGRSFDTIVKVDKVIPDATRTERRGGRVITTKRFEALVGDDTGCITLSARQEDKIAALKEGSTFVLLNVRMRRIGGDASWIEVDNWATIKTVEEAKDLIPENTLTTFEVNKAVDRSHRVAPKPVFTTIDKLQPEAKGQHMVVKVIEVKLQERSRMDGSVTKFAEATVGDETGRIVLITRGVSTETFQKDAILALFNAHIEMYNKGFMRLVVDRWSDVKNIDQVDKNILGDKVLTASSTIGADNRSDQEWILEEQNEK